MENNKKRIQNSLVLATSVILFIVLGFAIYFWSSPASPVLDGQPAELSTAPTTPSTTTAEEIVPQKPGRASLIKSNSVVCNDKSFIFDLVLSDVYFNNIYKAARVPENLLVHEQATGQGGNGALKILAVPKQNCDRMYLTRYVPESDAPVRGIFEWKIGGDAVQELRVSKAFSGFYAPFSIEDVISTDGEKIIISEPSGAEFCNRRTLRILRLRRDISEELVRLANAEALTSSNADDGAIGYCFGLSFGWQDESTVYYDVYDGTKAPPYPIKERRILKVN